MAIPSDTELMLLRASAAVLNGINEMRDTTDWNADKSLTEASTFSTAISSNSLTLTNRTGGMLEKNHGHCHILENIGKLFQLFQYASTRG